MKSVISRLLLFIFCLTIIVCLVACGGNNATNSSDESDKHIEAESTDLGGISVPTSNPTKKPALATNKPNPNGDDDGDDVYVGSVVLVPDVKITHPGEDLGVVGEPSYYELEPFLGKDAYSAIGVIGNPGGLITKYDFEEFSFIGREGDGCAVELLENDFLLLVKGGNKLDEIERRNNAIVKAVMFKFEEFERKYRKQAEAFGGLEIAGAADQPIFYKNITFSMPRTTVEKLIGKGIEGSTYLDTVKNPKTGEKEQIAFKNVFYKSEKTTMVISYNVQDYILNEELSRYAGYPIFSLVEEPVQAVGRIFIIAN